MGAAELGLLNGEGFVDYQSAGSNGRFNGREQGAVQVAKYQDGRKLPVGQGIALCRFQVNLPQFGGFDFLLSGDLVQRILPDIGKHHGNAKLREEQAIAAFATGQVENREFIASLREIVEVGLEQGRVIH